MYYGFKIPITINQRIDELFERCGFVKKNFNSNKVEFVREAIRMNLSGYILKGNVTEFEPYLEDKIGKTINPIQIHTSLYVEIEELFYLLPGVRRRFNSKKASFIRESMIKHVRYWLDVCSRQANN